MISPNSEPKELCDAELIEACARFFRPGGNLEKACLNETFPYEHRPQQYEMATEVAEAMGERHHLVVEAGTGVGKSFAYLVPAILTAKARGEKVVISTNTISLQEQLMNKDIPFLQKHLGVGFKAVLVKGRSNYLCLRRLDRSRRMGGDLFKAEQAVELDLIQRWADKTMDGSVQDMKDIPSSDTWSAVCAEQGNCLWQKCPEYGRCFFINARKEMMDADVLVVNHHLFFSEMALRAEGAAMLPPYSLLILDEAHHLEAVASEHLGLRLTHRMIEHWLRRIYIPEHNKGILAVLRDGKGAHVATQVREAALRFFIGLRKIAPVPDDTGQKIMKEPLVLESPLPDLIGKLSYSLRERADSDTENDVSAELQSLSRRGAVLRNELEAFMHQTLDDHVYWVEKYGRTGSHLAMKSAPIDVGEILEEGLFETQDCVVMTSATLAVNGNLDYFKQRIGATHCRSVSVGSPFQYEQQMRVYIPESMPDPNDIDAFAPACSRAIKHFVRMSNGRAFVLFTSAKMMNRVADLAGPGLQNAGYSILLQGAGTPRSLMLDRFRKNPGSVLFGLDSFWTGVDVRGSALSNVMITRFPFAVPDQPVVRARMDRIRDQGGNPFRDYALPEAILRFRQGVGRLIRTATDEGIVVILDGRVRTKSYGRLFLQALPECPVEVVDVSSCG